MSFVRGQVVENQRSVQRTARRDHTTPFSFVLAEISLFLGRMRVTIHNLVPHGEEGFLGERLSKEVSDIINR